MGNNRPPGGKISEYRQTRPAAVRRLLELTGASEDDIWDDCGPRADGPFGSGFIMEACPDDLKARQAAHRAQLDRLGLSSVRVRRPKLLRPPSPSDE